MLLRRRREWLRDGVVVEGEVVAIKERKSTSAKTPRPTFASVVSFRGDDGAPRRFTSSEWERPSRYEAGQRVMVRYLRDDAKAVDIDGVTRAVWPLLSLLLLATICVTVSILPFVLNR